MAHNPTGCKAPQRIQRTGPEPLEPLAVSTHKAAHLLGVSERHLRTMISAGEVRTIRLGARVLVPVGELRRIVGLPELGV